jgi:hypothetical protein
VSDNADIPDVLYNDGTRNSKIVTNGSIGLTESDIVLTNLSLTGRAELYFNIWASIEYGFGAQNNGELYLSLNPASTSIVGSGDYPKAKIATVIDPVTVTTKVSDLKIGYQYQPVADIIIKETKAGNLLASKTVKLNITDYVTTGFIFAPDSIVQVTSGDLKIKNISSSNKNGFTTQSGGWLSSNTSGTQISFDIDKISTTASEVTISNIGVQLDRTVPVTNKSSLQLVVWGTAIAENYGLYGPRTTDERDNNESYRWYAAFNTVGDIQPYINVVSTPPDESGILTQEVKFFIGESFYTVNGETVAMDVAPYISTVSNSTLVPARFLGNSLGIKDAAIVWDDTSKTASFFAPNKVIQFQLNNTNMYVDNAAVAMLSPDGKAVSAEIKDSRIFVPLRAFGVALGVSVDWEADTQTAIYNKGANANAQ